MGCFLSVTVNQLHEKENFFFFFHRGRFAVVKRCIRKSTGEEFAAKFIRKARAGRRGREQLVLEIDILHNSTHQKLVRLYDVFETRSEMILILE